MKDVYIVLDYSALEQEMSSVMTSHLNNYVSAKSKSAHGMKYFNSRRTMEPVGHVCDMNDPIKSIYEAVQFIKGKLWKYKTNNIKILVAGHGQFNENRGIVQGGASGTKVGVWNDNIADHILRITNHFKEHWINWSISLCVCFAGRPTIGYNSKIDKDSLVNDSMAGQLAKALHKRLPDFTLKANFTSVSVGDSGHIKADREQDQVRKFQLMQKETLARARYMRGFEFWSNKTTTEPISDWSMCFSLTYASKQAEISDKNVTSEPIQSAFLADFMILAEEMATDSKEFAESLNKHSGIMSDILNYRLIDMRIQSYTSTSIENANKVVWTCANGNLSHSLSIREQ